MAEIYTAADVFLNLTYEDNYPTVNLEAQACGTPVITYDTGGSVESSCPNGVVIKKNNLDNLSKTISALFKSILNRTDFSSKILLMRYVDVYRV